MSNSVFFVLTEETEVSLGLVVNMSGLQCMTFSSFSLTCYPVEHIGEPSDGIEAAGQSPGSGSNGILCDLNGRLVSKAQKGVYIINGKKVVK